MVILIPAVSFAGFKIATTIKLPVTEPVVWPETGIATQIPMPTITYNDVERFWVEIKGVNDEECEQYILDCQAAGFTIESERTSIEYTKS